MEIIKLIEKPEYLQDKKLNKIHRQIKHLLQVIEKHKAPNEIIETINKDILMINKLQLSPHAMRYHLKSIKKSMEVKISRSLHLQVPHYYRNRLGSIGLAIGTVISGIPIFITGEIAWLIVGTNLGFGIGVLIGMYMDKKAQAEGRQLPILLEPTY